VLQAIRKALPQLVPGITAPAREWEEDRCFRFDEPIAMPLIGTVENASAAWGASVRQNCGSGRATAS
jgi:hypothetical protein